MRPVGRRGGAGARAVDHQQGKALAALVPVDLRVLEGDVVFFHRHGIDDLYANTGCSFFIASLRCGGPITMPSATICFPSIQIDCMENTMSGWFSPPPGSQGGRPRPTAFEPITL